MNSFRNLKRTAVSAALAAALVACATVEPPEIEEADVPADWQGPLQSGRVWPNADWWTNFNDAGLMEFLEEVKANNFDLANNQRTLESAQLALREAGLARFPIPQVQISDNQNYTSSAVNGTTITEGNSSNPFQLTASASYSNVLTKPATYARALTDYDSRLAQSFDLAMNTLGTATSTYFNLLLIRDRIEAAEQNVANAEVVGNIARARLDAGISVPIDYLQQQIAIEQQRNSLRSLRQSELSARASLALLVGRHLQGFDIPGQTLQNIEVPTVQPGLPSELLWRRPDLYQAEMSLRSSALNVSIVRKTLFPTISLTANSGRSSPLLTDILTDPFNSTLSVTASIAQLLLDNGQRGRNIEQSRIQLETSLANYRRAVLGAFNEVELALSNIELLELQAVVARSNLDAAEESFRLAEIRYEEGVADYQTVLNAQNTLFSQRNSFLDNKLQRLNAIINFYQALGGGWEPPTDE